METNPFRVPPRGGGDPPLQGEPRSWARQARTWLEVRVEGQRWWYRLPLLLVMAWLLRGYLTQFQYSTIFSGITLGFHEMGHAFFGWFGNRTLTAAGGTIFQLAVPLGAALYLLVKQRDPFGATVGIFWLGTSLVDAGIYAADALVQELPLVSPFGPVDSSSHDWTTLLLRVGRISRAQEIGGALQAAGLWVMVASILAGAWILRLMARAGSPDPGGPEGR